MNTQKRYLTWVLLGLMLPLIYSHLASGETASPATPATLTKVGEPLVLLIGHTSFTTGCSWSEVDMAYPELWGRKSEHISTRFSQLSWWHRIAGVLRRTKWEESLAVSLTLEEKKSVTESYLWSPLGPVKATTYDDHSAARVEMAWQVERSTPLWRYGGRIGLYAADDYLDNPWQEVSIWVHRVVDPAVLHLQVTNAKRHAAQPTAEEDLRTSAKLGLDVALQPYLAVSAGVLYTWQPNQFAPQLIVESGVTRRYPDNGSWSVFVNNGNGGGMVLFSRSYPTN